jgi:hypothetical protein
MMGWRHRLSNFLHPQLGRRVRLDLVCRMGARAVILQWCLEYLDGVVSYGLWRWLGLG